MTTPDPNDRLSPIARAHLTQARAELQAARERQTTDHRAEPAAAKARTEHEENE